VAPSFRPALVRKEAPNPEPAPDLTPATGSGLEGLVIRLAAERTGFAAESIGLGARLLDDLNLDSIKAAELVAAVAKAAGAAGAVDPSLLANATLAEVVDTLRAALSRQAARQPGGGEPPGSGVREFAIVYVADGG
jgi:hypothetical protein